MKALVFSDLHVHNWPAFSRLNGEGINDRLMDTIRVIDDVCRIAKEDEVDCILFAGDFFHVPKIEAEVIALAARALERLGDLDIPIIAVEGNHDQAARVKSLTSVSGLSVPPKWQWLRRAAAEVQGVTIWGTAYGDHEPPGGPADIAILHRGIRGAAMSDYFNSPFEEDLDRNEAHQWAKKLVICGHFHKGQFLNDGNHTPILIPGAPLQHTWGDAGQERVLWTVDIAYGGVATVEWKVLTGYPQFIRVTEDNIGDLSRIDGNFVSVEISKPMPPEFIDELTTALTARARGFSITAEAPKIVRPVEERIEISGSTELDDVVRQYATKFGGDDAAELAKLGIEILKGEQ